MNLRIEKKKAGYVVIDEKTKKPLATCDSRQKAERVYRALCILSAIEGEEKSVKARLKPQPKTIDDIDTEEHG